METESSSAVAPSPIAPDRRSVTLDAVRGLAVLGILVMNLPFFAMPFQAVTNPAVWGGDSGADLATWYAQTVFFDGKMRGIFSMLFGAGLWLQWCKAQREGSEARFGDVWSRRCIWLVVFGMVHGYLLQWPGDILFAYGVTGLFLFPLRRLGTRGLVVAGVLVMLVATLMSAGGPFGKLEQAGAYATAVEARDAGAELSAEQGATIAAWQEAQEALDPDGDAIQGVLAAMRGSWGDSFVAQAGWTFKIETKFTYLWLFWDAMALMLLGIAFMRGGVFTGAARTRSYVVMLALGYGVAAPLLALLASRIAAAGFGTDALGDRALLGLLYQPARLAVGLAHVALVVLLCRTTVGAVVLKPLAAVGRMAFSNYVAQTLICTTFFLGFGFGWFGHLSRSEQMLVGVAVWTTALLVSPLWLRAFRFGPLEWAWRTLVYGQRQPLRRR